MRIIGIDFETYYADDYSLSKMTTEAYIRDPRFEIIGVSLKVKRNKPAIWFSGTHAEIVAFLDKHIDWDKDAVLCHNAVFDGAILNWHLDRRPKLWLDTLSMGRPLHLKTIGVSLAALAKYYKLGEKGLAVVDAKGKRRADFTPAQLKAYGIYCCNDIDLTYALLKILSKDTPPLELQCIDLTIRMFTEPKLVLNQAKLEEYHKSVLDNKQALLDAVTAKDRDAFMSNDKFAKLLIAEGVDPPTKWSAKQKKTVFAFAKTDKGMKDLLDHDSLRVQALAACRLGVKTTIEETRSQRFIDICKRGLLPVLLNYWGAGTGRYSGGDKINLQNLKRGGKLREALEAPVGCRVIGCDLSQIEARILALVAEQDDLVQDFLNKLDVYSIFATDVYGRPITKANADERFLGKTCLAAGTRVLTKRGWCAIEQVTLEDKLWDGEEWVCHDGVVFNGTKKTLKLSGVSMTPDHLVLCGAQWKEASYVAQDANTRCLALDTGAESLQSWATWLHKTTGSPHSSYPVPAQAKSTQSLIRTSGRLSLRDVISALRKLLPKKDTGSTQMPCQMTNTEQDCLIGLQRLSQDAIRQQANTTLRMVPEGYKYVTSGGPAERPFLNMFRRLAAGIIRTLKWIEKITIKGISQATLDLLVDQKTQQTNAKLMSCKQKSKSLKPVYDIANVGPRNRFTIKTRFGAMVVHNCVLGLGYYTGATKLRETLRQGGVTISIEEAQRIVKLYRKKYSNIPAFWRKCANALDNMVIGGSGYISDKFNIRYEKDKVILPNGAVLRYPGLQWYTDPETGERSMCYLDRNKRTKIYSGLLCENIIQALARGVIVEHLVTVGSRYNVVLQVHDEIVLVVLINEVATAKAFVETTMSTTVSWLPGLPIACEIKDGLNYGECK